MGQSMFDHDPLSGVRLPLVEDDALLAMDLEATLVDAAAVVVGVVPDPRRGDAAGERGRSRRGGARFRSWVRYASPLARRLVNRGLLFVLHTGRVLRINRAWLNGRTTRS